jgi:hypothetical protein
MTPRTLALVIAALAPMHVSSVNAQSVYVAPGGVYVGAGPVYVIPAPNHPGVGYVAPTYGNEYGPPVGPPPAVIAPTTAYGPGEGYYDAPLSAYGAGLPPRPPLAVPNYGNSRCVARYGYNRCY